MSLQLDGNRIKSLDNLRMLQSCLNLKSLRLQNLGADNYNPVCVEEEYRADVIRLLPQLRRLDCVAVAVMGFSNGK